MFSVDRLTWGFRFHVPKFADRDELYVVCDALICDHSDSKLYCDRSCLHPPPRPHPTRAPVRKRRLVRSAVPSEHVTATDEDKGAWFTLTDV